MLEKSAWYSSIKKNPNYLIVNIYANPNLEEECVTTEKTMTVKTEESYDNLSVKTYLMIKNALKYFDFDFLLKIDSSIILDKHCSVANLFSFKNFLEKFSQGFFSKEYNGYVKIEGNSIESFRSWASGLNLFVMPEALFTDLGHDKWPSWYWGGKAYSLSKSLALKIRNQEKLFLKFKNLMGGCEDFCIACALKH
jgi:hypothetical protein